MIRYDQSEWRKAHDDLRASAHRYGEWAAGMAVYADAARNVARMRRDAVHRIDLGNTDYEAWRRLRGEADRVLALWNAAASKSTTL